MKTKTREEKLWLYISKKLGRSPLAKQVFNRIVKELQPSTKEIHIKYNVDGSSLKEAIKQVQKLKSELLKIKVVK